MNATNATNAMVHAFRKELRLVGLWSLLINAGMLMPSLYMLQVYDRVLLGRNQLTLLMSTLLLVGVLLLVCLAEMVRSRLLVDTGKRIDKALAPELLQASFQSQRLRPQAQPAQALNDLTQVRQFLTGHGVFAFFDAPWVVIYIGVMFMLHPWLGFLAMGCGVVLLGIASAGHRLAAQPALAALKASQQVQAEQQAKLRNAQVIHAMGMLPALHADWESRHLRQMSAQQSVEYISHRLQAFSKFFRYTQQSLSLAMGAWLVVRGDISPGAMIVANTLMSRALQPLDLLVGTWRPMLAARAAWGRMTVLMRDHAPAPSGPNAQADGSPAIDCRAVSANAPGSDQAVLQSVSFQVPAGQVLCIMGPSGSGKSTLARVLLGVWPHSQGEVLLSGQPVQSLPTAWRAEHIGYLPQDLDLLPGTLAQNIARMGEVNSEQVVAAARQAGIHELILRLPQGYNTPTGEAGIMLSAGQKQRIGLARALYAQASLLVLDEPNAHLDDAAELALLATVQSLKSEGKTVVLITHRKPIVQAADWLLVLASGQVQHWGPPSQVLARMTAATTLSQGTVTTP